MDKIFKNNTVMGIVAIATLALVGYLAYQNSKSNKADKIVEETTEIN